MKWYKFLGSAVLALSLNACAGPRANPMPSFEDAPRSTEFNSYMNDLASRCRNSEDSPLHNDEWRFHRYLSWLESRAGIKLDKTRFDIVSDGFSSVFTTGIESLFMPEGLYWFGDILVRNEDLDTGLIAHEVGHRTDRHFSTADYMFDLRARIRMEAVAESFEHYAGIELMRIGNVSVGDQHIISHMNLSDANHDDDSSNNTSDPSVYLAGFDSLENIANRRSIYKAAQCLMLILRTTESDMGRTWHFVAKSSLRQVYARLEQAIEARGGFESAISLGYDMLAMECMRAKSHSRRNGYGG